MSSSITPINVVLASANLELLEVAKTHLSAARIIKLVGLVREGREAPQLVNIRRPTVFIVDIALPPAGALPVVARAKKRSSRTKVLTIGTQMDERRALQVAKAGASGYLTAEAIPAYLAKAVRCMALGEAWFSRKLMAKIVDEFQQLGRLEAQAGRRRSRRAAPHPTVNPRAL